MTPTTAARPYLYPEEFYDVESSPFSDTYTVLHYSHAAASERNCAALIELSSCMVTSPAASEAQDYVRSNLLCVQEQSAALQFLTWRDYSLARLYADHREGGDAPHRALAKAAEQWSGLGEDETAHEAHCLLQVPH